jgi:mediator of RNA polymerase II transcription subunit 12
MRGCCLIFFHWKFSLLVLENATTADLLTAVIETIQRYLTIWTCKNAVGLISAALHSAHQVWRSRGFQSRLLALLVEVDNGRYLDVVSREQVAGDISSFTHVRDSQSSDAFC